MSDETPEPTEPHAVESADTPTTESPVPESPATEPAAAPTKKASEPIQVPRWAAVVVAALLLVGVGFGIGWIAAPGGSDHGPDSVRIFPGGLGGRGGFQFGPGSGNGGGGSQQPANPSGGAYLGVEIGTPSGSTQGAQVQNVVSGGPADQAGLKTGDLITAVGGTSVSSPSALAQQISSHQPGDQVTITYTRSGSSAQAQVKLGTRPSTTQPTAPPA